jgi:hypothetical protein
MVTVKAGKNNIFKIRIDLLKNLVYKKKELNKKFLELTTLKGFSPVLLIEEEKVPSLIKITLEDGFAFQVSHDTKLILVNNTAVKAKKLNISSILFGRKKIKNIEEIVAANGFEMYSIQMKTSNSVFVDDIAIEL